EQEENRRLAHFPPLKLNITAIEGLPEAFTAYFNDNFGFRPTLVHLQAFTKLRLLSVSSSPVVIAGKDGWLFLAREYSATGQHLVPPYSERQLHDWQVLLDGRRDWLARRNARYVFVIFPRKETIYPEFLPDSYK